MWFIQGASCLTAGHECPKEIVKIAKKIKSLGII